MQLDYNCVRDLLLTLESNLEIEDDLQYPMIRLSEICEYCSMNDYSKGVIAYTATKLVEADYLEAKILEGDGHIIDIWFYSISFDGHQYLDRIRDDSLWSKIKGRISQAGSSISIEVISAVAIKLLSEKLGL